MNDGAVRSGNVSWIQPGRSMSGYTTLIAVPASAVVFSRIYEFRTDRKRGKDDRKAAGAPLGVSP
jgi:hypothetical protein